MKAHVLLALMLPLVGCSQTAPAPAAAPGAAPGAPTSSKPGGKPPVTAAAAPGGKAKAEEVAMAACEETMKKQMDQAMIGSALGMAGGAFGFAGRGGAIASQVASTAGSLVAAQKRREAEAAIRRDCYPQGAPVDAGADDEIW